MNDSIRKYLSEIGRKGGKTVTPKKLAALKKNAKLGGWRKGRPRKTPVDIG